MVTKYCASSRSSFVTNILRNCFFQCNQIKFRAQDNSRGAQIGKILAGPPTLSPLKSISSLCGKCLPFFYLKRDAIGVFRITFCQQLLEIISVARMWRKIFLTPQKRVISTCEASRRNLMARRGNIPRGKKQYCTRFLLKFPSPRAVLCSPISPHNCHKFNTVVLR